ncbi:MAG: formyltetrahydrofolate deformylase [Alphaproteobacteria bacterium]|nr:formyltetrahydrofolate deformylase [Alphaproteobacteria bacterium]
MTTPVVLTISCPDRTGLVAGVTTYLASRNLFIDETHQFGDPETGRFFMRTVFHPAEGVWNARDFAAGFAPVAQRFECAWDARPTSDRLRAIVMVSRFDHCLADLIYRVRTGALSMDIAAVISNHTAAKALVEREGIPFIHQPVDAARKSQAEAVMFSTMEREHAELVVLARYMQVLSADACGRLAGRCINIHHSFLPGFKGANPYQQAHTRGVKLIGATAHYVTEDLDEGPIIEQMVERVDHAATVADMVHLGQDLEAITLARALKAHIERRVFVNGRKTVVLR